MRPSELLRYLFFGFTYLLLTVKVNAQRNMGNIGNMGSMMGRGGGISGSASKGTKNDSLQRRDQFADSITIFYKYYNSNDAHALDTSINDFFVHYPVPYTSYTLGNLGAASKSYFSNPISHAGLDNGFHAFDTYFYTLDETPFYQTTRPYTELGYLLGGKGEQ